MTIQRVLAYLRFGVAGAIGGTAVLNTIAKFSGTGIPTDSAEGIAMGIGAVFAATVIKVLHIV